MRGTQWKAFIDKAINTMENHPKDATLLQNLGVDRLASLALRVVEAFPQYSESHPETTRSQARINVVEPLHFLCLQILSYLKQD